MATNETYKVTMLNCPDKSTYSMYISGISHLVGGGMATGPKYTFEVSSEYIGEATVKVHIPKRTRTFSNIAFPISFKANGQDVTLDVREHLAIHSPLPAHRSFQKEEKPAPEETDTQKEAKEVIKNVTSNKLRKKISKKKTGNSFWDNLK